jgi:hypothetical protein
MVIEIPEGLEDFGREIAAHVAEVKRTRDRLGGGKAVDYGEIERVMAENVARTELAAHRAILHSLDIDVPAVIIGGVRYTKVGRCEGTYHTMVGSTSFKSFSVNSWACLRLRLLSDMLPSSRTMGLIACSLKSGREFLTQQYSLK